MILTVLSGNLVTDNAIYEIYMFKGSKCLWDPGVYGILMFMGPLCFWNFDVY